MILSPFIFNFPTYGGFYGNGNSFYNPNRGSEVVNRGGIPKFNSLDMVIQDTAEEVEYFIDPTLWRSLLDDGVMLFEPRQHAPEADDSYAVMICARSGNGCGCNGSANLVTAPLLDHANEQVESSQLERGQKYLIYFNKEAGVYQLISPCGDVAEEAAA